MTVRFPGYPELCHKVVKAPANRGDFPVARVLLADETASLCGARAESSPNWAIHDICIGIMSNDRRINPPSHCN
jgi:hypothetical protein